VTGARAQSASNSPFQPQLADPQHAQRFWRPREPAERDAEPERAPRSSAGDTGFDSTGSLAKKKKTKRKPGEARPEPPPPSPPPEPSQQLGSSNGAQQVASRASDAGAYRPPDAPLRRQVVPVKDAFEPLGVNIGTFLLRPSIEVTRGWDTNPSRQPSGQGSAFTTVEPSLQLRSQWSRHAFGADLRGSFTDYDQLPSSNRPLVDAKIFTRIDVSRDTHIDTESRFLLSTDYPGSPNLPADIAKLPIYTSYGTTAGLTQRFNRFELSGKASVDRTEYQDSKLTDGTTSSNHDRDYDQYGGQVRASYEVWPGVKPFAELGGDTRLHDLPFDRNNFQRDSRALAPKVGTSFELTRILTGEVSVGYLTRHYQDPSLQDLRGVVADASLVWAASGLTKATLTANSRADELVVAGASGVLRRDIALQVDHAFRRWLIGTVKVGYGFDDYVGLDRADTRVSLGSAITYKLNRDLSFKGEYRYDRLRSNAPDVDYDANVFMIGLKLQR
jgi:hypothetical protein